MRAIISVVESASVEIVDKNIKNSIWKGYLIYIWISTQDIEMQTEKINKFVEKIWQIRYIFNEDTKKIDKSLKDIDWEILLISNFTLYWKNKKGNQLDFIQSAWFKQANDVYQKIIQSLEENWYKLQVWEFWWKMKILSENLWPLNYVWEF